MKKTSVGILTVIVVLMITAVSGAQWGQGIVDEEVVLSGDLAYLVMDGKEYRASQFDGAKEVKIYVDYVIIRKGHGETAAVYIPMKKIDYLVLD